MSDDSRFEVTVNGSDPVHVSCAGELDLATVPVLREAMAPIDDDIELDCEGLTFLDSSGAGLFASQRARLREQGHELRLTNLQDLPRRTVEILGLDDLIA